MDTYTHTHKQMETVYTTEVLKRSVNTHNSCACAYVKCTCSFTHKIAQSKQERFSFLSLLSCRARSLLCYVLAVLSVLCLVLLSWEQTLQTSLGATLVALALFMVEPNREREQPEGKSRKSKIEPERCVKHGFHHLFFLLPFFCDLLPSFHVTAFAVFNPQLQNVCVYLFLFSFFVWCDHISVTA